MYVYSEWDSGLFKPTLQESNHLHKTLSTFVSGNSKPGSCSYLGDV